jgi:hypothetical protein
MTAIAFILLGVFIGSAISDLVFDYRIYSVFPQQSRRWWPGSGYWMAWKTIAIARNARNRLLNIHSLATTFPAFTAHRDETKAFVSTMKKFSDVGVKPSPVHVELVQDKPEVKP